MTSSSPGNNPLGFWRTSLVFFILSSCCDGQGGGSGLQRFTVRPESVTAVEGDDVTLRCVIQEQQGRVQWAKDGFALGFERHVPGYPRYTYLGDARQGQHHLFISQVSVIDDGEYQCQVGPTFSNPPIWASANLTVLLAPSSIRMGGHLDGSTVEVSEGEEVTLRCSVDDARPPPKILWYIAGKQVDQAHVRTVVVRSSMPGRWSVGSQVTVRAGASEDNKRVTCRAIHPGVPSGTILTSSVILSVAHRPGLPVVNGYQAGDALKVGEQRTLTCRIEGGNPAPSLIWYREGHLLDNTHVREESEEGTWVTINALDIVGRKGDDGVRYECRATSPLQSYPLAANITLAVHYGPEAVRVEGPVRIEEGGVLTLRCHADEANPAATLTWIIEGESVTSPGSVVSRVGSGAWVATSQLVWRPEERSRRAGQVRVECRASHPALPHFLHHTLIVTIVKVAGAPWFEGEVLGELMSGSTVIIVCSSPGTHTDTTIRLYKGEEVVLSETEPANNLTRVRGEVRVTPADNGAQVKCEVNSLVGGPPKVTTTRLAVLFSPRSVSGSATPTPVEEGSVATLTCLTSSSRPPANLTWTSLGTILHPTSTEVVPAAFGGFSTRSELELKVTAEDNKRTFLCHADNGLGSPLLKTITIKVLHAPVWRGVPEPKVDVWEGSDATITMTAVANPGPVRYWWRRGRETLVGTGGVLRLGQAHRDMTDNYTVSAYTGRGAINNTFLLNVKYGPENMSAPERVVVGEGETINIKCTATGHPTPHLHWTYRNETVASGVGEAILVIVSAGPDQTGIYHCQAITETSQPSPAVTTKIIVKQGVSISDQEEDSGKASWVSVGGQGKLVCRVRAHPPPTFTWTSQGRTIHNDNKFTIHDPEVVDGVATWVSVLEVDRVTPTDYRTYRCSATNTLGSDSTSIVLRPPQRPLPPSDLTVIHVRNASVTLGWAANTAGGRPQGYTVRYKATGTTDYQYEDVTAGNETEVTVGGLMPGLEYTISSRALNTYGNSDYVTPALTFTTLGGANDGSSGIISGVNGSVGSTSGHLTSMLFLIIIVLAAVALLIVNIAIAMCLLRHYRNKRSSIKSTGSTKTTSVTTQANTSSSSPETHLHHHHHHAHSHSHLAALKHKETNNKKKTGGAATSKGCNINAKVKPSKQTRANMRAITSLLQNGKIPPETLKYTKGNKRGRSQFVQVYHSGNGSTSNGRAKRSPILISPEARSLISHEHNSHLTTLTHIENTDAEDDQASDTSHESTETAIYCNSNNLAPAHDVGNPQLEFGGENDQELGFQQDVELQQEGGWQAQEHGELSNALIMGNTNEVNQSMIMSELQEAITQRIEQSQQHTHHLQDIQDGGVNKQPASSQTILQPSRHKEYLKPVDKAIFSQLIKASASATSDRILARALKHSKLEPSPSPSARHHQQNLPQESPTIHDHNPPIRERRESREPTSPVRATRQYRFPIPPPRTQGHQPDFSAQVQHDLAPHSSKYTQQLLVPDSHTTIQHRHSKQSLPTRTQMTSQPESTYTKQHFVPDSQDIIQPPHSRHSSPTRVQMGAQTKSQVRQQYSPKQYTKDQQIAFKRSDHQAHYSKASLDQLNQTALKYNQGEQKSMAGKRIPVSPLLITVSRSTSISPHNMEKRTSQQNPRLQQHLPSSSRHTYPLPPPSPEACILQPPSRSSPSPGSLPHPSPATPLTPFQKLPTPPPIHHRPPPTPPRLRYQRRSLSPITIADSLPPIPPYPTGQHHQSSHQFTQHTQTPKLTHSRQQSRSMSFKESISRSLEDYSAKVATKEIEDEDSKTTAKMQKDNRSSMNVLTGSSAVSISLPKDINIRDSVMRDSKITQSIQYEGHRQQLTQPIRSFAGTIMDDSTPAATSSPLTGRRRARFPDDFLWQGSPGK